MDNTYAVNCYVVSVLVWKAAGWNMHFMYIVWKNVIYLCTSLIRNDRKVRILPAFWPVSQRGQIIVFLPTMCEDCAHSVMSKSSKQVPNIIEKGRNVM